MNARSAHEATSADDVDGDSRAAPVLLSGAGLTIEDVVAVARGRRSAALSRDPDVVGRITKCKQFFDAYLARGGCVYGVNTGYGDSVVVEIPPHLVAQLPHNLVRYHGCGTGAFLDERSVLAVLMARVNSLARGYSAVRWELLERLEQFIAHRILPRIPSEGSVGASGDLTPLSYIAAAVIGEREVSYQGRVRPTADVLQELGWSPLRLEPKEGLAIMNGTSVMTALACLAWDRAAYLAQVAARATALAAIALRSHRDQFHPRLFAVKPHEGQATVARLIYRDLEIADQAFDRNRRLQDRYSIRCAPHVIGVLQDALTWMRRDVQNELNSANDNPIVDGEAGLILHGGHFYGGHIGFAMDALKTACASVADLMDRQLALLVDSKFNEGLPSNLSGAPPEVAAVSHGFKAVQISTSAWAAEALKLTMPATSFSRSTESHNQDKVSMGTIAARDCLRVLELAEQVAAALVLGACQAIRLRERAGQLDRSKLSNDVNAFLATIESSFELLTHDRALDAQLIRTTQSIVEQELSLRAA